ncbi:MAG: family 16 glycoside hydrolase, partial [Acidobacteriota bacterium]
MRRATRIFFLAAAVLFAAHLLPGLDDAADLKSRVTGLLGRYPAATAADKDALSAENLKLGPAAVGEICGRVLAPGAGDDSTARFALNGLAVHVTRSGADKERLLFVRALLAALGRIEDKDVKAFLISQLQLSGGKECVKPLAGYLADGKLAEPAAQALLAIRLPETAPAFLKALDSVPAAAKITIIKALGELRSRDAVKKILPYAGSADDNVRRTALFALANIGDPRAGQVLDKARIAASPYERSQAPALYLLYARRLVESGNASDGLAICRGLLKYYATPAESHVAANALGLIAAALKDRALPDLLAAADSPVLELRAAALELAMSIPGDDATAKWIEKAATAPAEVRAEIISMLGRRTDASALPAVRQALGSPDKPVRLAAIPAAVRLGGEAVLPDLFPFFVSGDAGEIAAAREAVLGFGAALVVPEAVRLMESAPPAGQAALIEVLAEKGARDRIDLVFARAESPEPEVRAAAIAALAKLAGEKDLPRIVDLLVAASDSGEIVNLQNAVAAAAGRNADPARRADALIGMMADAAVDKKAAILKVLPRVGGAAALKAATDETASKDPKIQAAGVYALSEWPDFGAADELLRIVTSTANKKYLLMALEGYVRLVNKADFPFYRKLELLKNALGLPKDDADRKAVLRGIAENRGPAAFRMLADFLGNRELGATAAQLLLETAAEQAPEERWLSGHEAISILKRIEAASADPAERELAAKTIAERLKQGGYAALFNGRDLDGWKGLVADPPARAKMTPEELKKAQAAADERMRAHWRVADGALVFDAKGESLCTVRDYGDFELLVDWKIEKAGDSGIYLRGSPQVQIWDPDGGPANAVGSGGLYNNQKGASKPLVKADLPVGQWNTFRIIMIGERVTVYLNDKMVVDNTSMENYWERDKPIYPAGQIELQAHGNPLSFKDVYIREIPRGGEAPGVADAEKDEGFAALFDGTDLVGWTGDTKGYAVENGAIVVHPETGGGNLYTEKEYA